jgi:hypothetical protein
LMPILAHALADYFIFSVIARNEKQPKEWLTLYQENTFRHYYIVLAQGLSIWKLCASCTYPKHENCDKCVNSGPENRSSLPIGLEMQTWMRFIQTLNYFIWYIFDIKKR